MPGAVRRTYLTKAISERLGKTKGRPACAGDGGPHTEACRKRIEETRIKVNGSVLTAALASSGTTESMELETAGLDLGEQQMVLALSVLATVILAAPKQL